MAHKILAVAAFIAALLSWRGISVADDTSAIDALVEVLAEVDDAALQSDLLRGMHEALRGRKRVEQPAGWPAAYRQLQKSEDTQVRQQATELALLFGDATAAAATRRLMDDEQAPPARRLWALNALVGVRVKGLGPELLNALDDQPLRAAALRGLAAYAEPRAPRAILGHYENLTDDEKTDAVNTLASRPEYARALLDALADGRVPRGDVSAFTARQLLAYGDESLSRKLRSVWGELRPTSEQKQELLARYKALLTPAALAEADAAAGRRVFKRICGQCHRLYGEGGSVGPDLTGSNRKNLDYVLENVLDPSAAIAKDYKLQILVTEDGRLLTGIVVDQSPQAVTVQTVNERVIVPREDIAQMQPSEISMMPEGALDKLSPTETRDLVGYLRTTEPVEPSE